MKKVTTQRRSFPLIWVWVIFLVILGIGYSLYELFVPCSPGLVAVDCVFTKIYMYISLFEAAIAYLCIAAIYRYVKTSRHQNPRMWVYLIIGVISLLWVLAPMWTDNYIVLVLSAPIIYINMFFMFGAGLEIFSQFIH